MAVEHILGTELFAAFFTYMAYENKKGFLVDFFHWSFEAS